MSHKSDFQPKIIGVLCNWSGYKAADLSGAFGLQYPSHIRLIRVMCSGRVDPSHVFSAFSCGADGVFIGACPLGSCHYWNQGNYAAVDMVQLCKTVLEYLGIRGERLCMLWMKAGDGLGFAQSMRKMSTYIEQLGPLGKAEGISDLQLMTGLDQIMKRIPEIQKAKIRQLRHWRGHDFSESQHLSSRQKIDHLLKNLFF